MSQSLKTQAIEEESKYNEIIELNPINLELNISEIADYLIDLEYDTFKNNNVNPCITLRNINFIISCYIWYYIRDDDNWEIINSLTDEEKHIAEQYLLTSHYEYKSKYYFEQQPGIIHTVQRIPKSLFIGSTVGIASSIGAFKFCMDGAVGLLSANIESTVQIFTQSDNAKDAIIKLPTIPLGICASIIIGGIVGATTLIAIPVATLGSAGLYLVNGTDLTDMETWQYIGATKLNLNEDNNNSNNKENNDQ